MKPTKLDIDACVAAANVYDTLTMPIVQHILYYLEQERDVQASRMVSSNYRYHTILKYLRKLETLKLVRKERLGNEVSYRLNHARLDLINTAAESI